MHARFLCDVETFAGGVPYAQGSACLPHLQSKHTHARVQHAVVPAMFCFVILASTPCVVRVAVATVKAQLPFSWLGNHVS